MYVRNNLDFILQKDKSPKCFFRSCHVRFGYVLTTNCITPIEIKCLTSIQNISFPTVEPKVFVEGRGDLATFSIDRRHQERQVRAGVDHRVDDHRDEVVLRR
jgi:hypothetical protein